MSSSTNGPTTSSPRKITAQDELQSIQNELTLYRSVFTQISQLSSLSSIHQLTTQILHPPNSHSSSSFATPALSLWLSRPRVGVGVVLLAPGIHPGRVLIGQRKGSHGVGKWALPGGHLEGGEKFEVCAAREIQEETGIDLLPESIKFLTATNDIMNADGGHYVTIFMGCILDKNQVDQIMNTEPDKCEGWVWLPWEDVQVIPKFMPLQHFIEEGGIDLVQVFEQTCYSSNSSSTEEEEE